MLDNVGALFDTDGRQRCKTFRENCWKIKRLSAFSKKVEKKNKYLLGNDDFNAKIFFFTLQNISVSCTHFEVVAFKSKRT